MKKSFLAAGVAAILSLAATQTQAQVSLGLKGGANVSNLNGLSVNNFETNATVGFHIGGYAAFNLGRNFAIQPELMYSTQGAKLENSTSSENLKLNYFNVPVMAKFITNSGFYFEAGPQVGFRTGDVTINSSQEDLKSGDFSVAGGLGFVGKKQGFGLGARYNVGVSKIGDANSTAIQNADYKNGVLQISLYMRLFGGGKLKK